MREYQLIRRGGLWHLTQQQARPPKREELACHTSCGKWAEMKDGFQKGRPDCPTCIEHVRVFEQKEATPLVSRADGLYRGEQRVATFIGVITRGCLDLDDIELEVETQRSLSASRRRRLRA